MARRSLIRSCTVACSLLLAPLAGRCQDRADYGKNADSLAVYRTMLTAIAQDSQLTGPDRQTAQALLAATELCYESVYALSQMKKLDACLSQESRSTMGNICYDYEFRSLNLLSDKKDSIDAWLQRTNNPAILATGGQLSNYLSRITDQIRRWIKRRKF